MSLDGEETDTVLADGYTCPVCNINTREAMAVRAASSGAAAAERAWVSRGKKATS